MTFTDQPAQRAYSTLNVVCSLTCNVHPYAHVVLTSFVHASPRLMSISNGLPASSPVAYTNGQKSCLHEPAAIKLLNPRLDHPFPLASSPEGREGGEGEGKGKGRGREVAGWWEGKTAKKFRQREMQSLACDLLWAKSRLRAWKL